MASWRSQKADRGKHSLLREHREGAAHSVWAAVREGFLEEVVRQSPGTGCSKPGERGRASAFSRKG